MFCHGCFFSESLPSACISVTKSKKSLLHTTMIYDHIFAWRRANMKWRTAGSMALHTTHTHTHTHIHTHFITSAPSWNWESLLEFIFWGQGNVVHILGSTTNWRWWGNVDSHFWMLEDWVLSMINVVGLEDWNCWLERIFVLIHDTWACFVGQDSCTPWWRFGRLLVAS